MGNCILYDWIGFVLTVDLQEILGDFLKRLSYKV